MWLKLRLKSVFVLLLLFPSLGWCPPLPWNIRIADKIIYVMRHVGEIYWLDGKNKIPITEKYILDRVNETLEASNLNPGWGNTKQATKRLLVGIYTQSRFWKYAYNEKLNKNGSKDIGIAQINTEHFKNGRGDWFIFCREQGMKHNDPKQLWIPAINIKFMAWYNQRALERDMDLYHFNRTVDQKRLYTALLKVTDEDEVPQVAEK